MTYDTRADIYQPYGYTKRLAQPSPIQKDYTHGKTKMAAWFVTKCQSSSQRERLVEALQKHMEVDVYGTCGPLKCPKAEWDKCEQKLNTEYWFYFAFENTLAQDYFTEKVILRLKGTLVPVVYGGARYAEVLPPHSFINAQDFSSPAELASYLTYLTTNATAYNQYFSWKQYYTVDMIWSQRFCNLCAALHQNSPPQSSAL